MEELIIVSYAANSEGVVLETNVPGKLKGLNVQGKHTFVSWDKLGAALFEGYADGARSLEARRVFRREISEDEE